MGYNLRTRNKSPERNEEGISTKDSGRSSIEPKKPTAAKGKRSRKPKLAVKESQDQAGSIKEGKEDSIISRQESSGLTTESKEVTPNKSKRGRKSKNNKEVVEEESTLGLEDKVESMEFYSCAEIKSSKENSNLEIKQVVGSEVGVDSNESLKELNQDNKNESNSNEVIETISIVSETQLTSVVSTTELVSNQVENSTKSNTTNVVVETENKDDDMLNQYVNLDPQFTNKKATDELDINSNQENDEAEVIENDQVENSDDEADNILNELLAKNNYKMRYVESNEQDLVDEENEKNEESKIDSEDSEDSEYFSLSEEEKEIDENLLRSLLDKAKKNLADSSVTNVQIKNKAFQANGTFYNPYDAKIKEQLYIKNDNIKNKNKENQPASIQNQKELIKVNEDSASTNIKRKSSDDPEIDFNLIDEDQIISSEVANALAVSSRKGLEELRMNRALPEYRLTHAEAKREKEANAGKKWFNMEAPEMTEELKKDLQVLKLRKVLDRKRFYKKDNKSLQSKYFQVGTIIEDKSEFYSGRLAKKDRKQTILQEVLHDKQAQTYFKDRFQQHQQSIRANPKKPSVLKKFKYRK